MCCAPLMKNAKPKWGPEMMRVLERLLLLDRIDDHWKEHLHNIDYIEEGIRFGAGYGGKDPIVVFKNEALAVFESMYQQIEEQVSEFIFKSRVNTEAPAPGLRVGERVDSGDHNREPRKATVQPQPATMPNLPHRKQWGACLRVGRNAPCPCGSGKKYKRLPW